MRVPEMPVAVYRNKGEIAVDVKPVPVPGDGEVLVEVSHCGVCGTDIHMVIEGWGQPGTVGGDEVVVSEPAPSRRERASAVGAATALQPGELALPPLPMDLINEPFDAVLECSGRADAMEVGLAQLGHGGRLVLVGTGMHAPRLDNNRILLNELLITGAYNYDSGGFASALRLLASGRLPVDELIEPEDV